MIGRLALLATSACADPVSVAMMVEKPVSRQVSYVKSPGTHQEDEFGHSIAVNQKSMIIGLPGSSNDGAGFDVELDSFGIRGSGAIAIFNAGGAGWEPGILSKSSAPDVGDLFGGS